MGRRTRACRPRCPRDRAPGRRDPGRASISERRRRVPLLPWSTASFWCRPPTARKGTLMSESDTTREKTSWSFRGPGQRGRVGLGRRGRAGGRGWRPARAVPRSTRSVSRRSSKHQRQHDQRSTLRIDRGDRRSTREATPPVLGLDGSATTASRFHEAGARMERRTLADGVTGTPSRVVHEEGGAERRASRRRRSIDFCG